VKAVYTNKAPGGVAYRCSFRITEAVYLVERMVGALALEMGADQIDLRMNSFIKAEQFPYTAMTGLTYDSGDHLGAATKAKQLVGYDDLRAQQAQRREAGSTKHLGIGMSTYVEMCGLAPSRVLASLNYGAGGWESATVRLLPTGKVQVVTGTSPHGQGHETSWSMIVADKFGISPDDVEVLHSDTLISPIGMDTYGSRSLSVGGVAVDMAAQKVLDKAKVIAAHQLEANEDDLEFVSGEFRVKGTPTISVPIQAIAFAAFTAHDLPEGIEPNLSEQVTYDPPNFTFPFGTHVAVVEIDEETGGIRLIDYAAVDDCGNQVNPLIVNGQLHGGIVQGVAQALWEEAVYDDEGQLRNPTMLDYLVPSAAELPQFKLDSTVTPSPTNPLGVKGIGEAGTIGSAPAVINAVVDALSHLGVTDCLMPATPNRLWSMMAEARGAGR
jgi:carbon-monoxide dehydrogenase large subunit